MTRVKSGLHVGGGRVGGVGRTGGWLLVYHVLANLTNVTNVMVRVCMQSKYREESFGNALEGKRVK